MSKRTKQRATIVDKHCFCFIHFNLRFPLTPRRECSPFLSFQALWRWIAETTAKWENDYTGRKKDQNQSGSGSFSAVPEEPGNFLVVLPRWLEAQPAGAAGSSRVSWGGDGWDIGHEEWAASWGERKRQFKCKHWVLQTALIWTITMWSECVSFFVNTRMIPTVTSHFWYVSTHSIL